MLESPVRPFRIRTPGLEFALVYAGLAALMLGAYSFPYGILGFEHDWLLPYLSFYARAAGAIVQVFDPTVRVVGNEIVGAFPLRIVRNCDAMEVKILFASAILAFPARAKRKLFALCAGLASITVLNLLRICSLYYLGLRAPAYFERAHAELWPLLMIAGAVLFFLVCTRWLVPRLSPADGPHAP